MSRGEFPDVMELVRGEEGSDPFARLIAIATVVTTLIAALVAFAQASALRTDDEAAVRAERLAASALAASVSGQTAAQAQFERFQRAEEQRGRAAGARQRRVFQGDTPELALEEKRWERVAQDTDRGSKELEKVLGAPALTPTSPDGPANDPNFPVRYYGAASVRASRLTALRDAANERGNRAEEQFTDYAVALTMLAVAVFLFGYSLTPSGKPRRQLFSGVALAFVTIASLWALWTALDPPDTWPDKAADHYADGRAAFDRSDYREAIRQLDRSLALRPTSAQALALRADANYLLGTPQIGGFTSLTTPESLERSIADFDRAVAAGSEDPQVFASLGFQLTRLGVERDSDAVIEQGRRAAERSTDELQTNPIPAFNSALASIALRDRPAADEALREAIERVTYVDAKRKKLRTDVIAKSNYVAGWLTDLEIIRKHRPDAIGRGDPNGYARRVVDALQSRTDSPEVPQSGKQTPYGKLPRNVPVAGVRSFARPAFAVATFDSTRGFKADRDRMYLAWYYREPGLGWSALAPISGPVQYGELLGIEDNRWQISRNFLTFTSPPRCLRPGDYRVELWVNGRMAVRQDTKAEFPRFVGDRGSGVPLSVCRPRAWRQSQAAVLPGLRNAYRSGDDGVLLYKVTAVSGRGTQAKARRVMNRVVADASSVIGGTPRQTGTLPNDFADADQDVGAEYRYPGGRVLAGAGIDRGGDVLVGVVFGNEQLFARPPDGTDSLGEEIFATISQSP